MKKSEIFAGIVFIFGLGISLASVFNAKLAGDIDQLYNAFIAVIFCFGNLVFIMSKN